MTFLQTKKTSGSKHFVRKGKNSCGEESRRKRKRSMTERPKSPDQSRRQPSTIEIKMLITIPIKAENGDVQRNQELLREDWTRQTIDAVLLLLRKLIGHGLIPGTYSWQKVFASPS